MGCDIHFYAEKRNAQGNWDAIMDTCEYCGGSKESDYRQTCTGCGKLYSEWEDNDVEADHLEKKCLYGAGTLELKMAPCDWCRGAGRSPMRMSVGRNYDLFGVLSAVRGSPEPEFTQHDRGVPDDASEEYRRISENIDWHSHGWYTLRELRERDWKDFPKFKEVIEALAEHGDPDNIRAVFHYDN